MLKELVLVCGDNFHTDKFFKTSKNDIARS